MPAGVEAPAVSPAAEHPAKIPWGSSSALSTWSTRGHSFMQISVRCFVLALFRSPTTTITSTWPAMNAASVCRLCVALHIVSKIFTFVHSFFRIFQEVSKSSRIQVVCATTVRGISRFSGASDSHFFTDAGPSKTRGARHQLATPITSGWCGSPMMTGWRPSLSASATSRWIRTTFGQVALTH